MVIVCHLPDLKKKSEFAEKENMKCLKTFILFLGLITLHIPAFADTVYLRDGRVYMGKFAKGDKNGIQFKVDTKMMGFPVSSVSFISVGEKDLDGREANGKGKGVLKGIVTYDRNIDSQSNPGPQPDFGAKVYVCKLKVNNILIFYKYDELLHSDDIDSFIKDYIKYRWAKWNRNLLSKQNLNGENLKDILREKQAQLKRLNADTEKGWEGVRNRGRAVFSKLNSGEISTRIAIAAGDGRFSLQLPAGYYFLLAQSQKNELQDAYVAVKISDRETTQASLEIAFLN